MTANTTKLSAPKGAMPEMPEPEYQYSEYERDLDGGFSRITTDYYTADQMRAMYLAGLEAAKACVPGAATNYKVQPCDEAKASAWNACRETTLTALTALEQEAKK